MLASYINSSVARESLRPGIILIIPGMKPRNKSRRYKTSIEPGLLDHLIRPFVT